MFSMKKGKTQKVELALKIKDWQVFVWKSCGDLYLLHVFYSEKKNLYKAVCVYIYIYAIT